jgi:hypothetical protein
VNDFLNEMSFNANITAFITFIKYVIFY